MEKDGNIITYFAIKVISFKKNEENINKYV